MADDYGPKGEKYSVNQRVRGGAYVGRLNPDCVDPRLNAKLRPSWPSPMARETSTGSVPEPLSGRKARIEMNDRFRR